MVPKMHTFGYSLFAVGRAWVSVSGSIPCQKKIIECGITAGKAPVVDADARRSYGGAFPKRGLHEVWDGTRIRPFSARRPTALAMNGCG